MTTYKIAVVGGAHSGKFSLIKRFAAGSFGEGYEPCLEATWERAIDLDRKRFNLEVSYVIPQEDFELAFDEAVKNSDGFIICYAIDLGLSFKELGAFHERIIKAKGIENVPLVICGNKCDLESQRGVSKEEGEKFAKRLNAPFFETSAATNVNIDEAFRAVVSEIQLTVHNYNIVVLGSVCSGKTGIVDRFARGTFDSFQNTMVVETYSRDMEIDSEKFHLEVSAVTCLEDHEVITHEEIRKADGFIITYTIYRQESLEEVETFHSLALQLKGVAKIPLVVCACMCDREDLRKVSKEEGEKLAERMKVPFFETSAATNMNIDEAFRALLCEIQKKRESNESDAKSEKKHRKRHRGECTVL